MVRSTPTPGQDEPRHGRQQFDHQQDLQAGGGHASDRATYENPRLDEALDSAPFHSQMSFGSESKGNWWASAKIRLGNTDFSPATLAAMSAGVSVFFILGGGLLVIAGHPGYAFATFLLAFITLLAGIGFAFYESGTRRAIAQADIAKLSESAAARAEKANEIAAVLHDEMPRASTAMVEFAPLPPAGHAERDLTPESLLHERIVENPASPRSFDGGETI
jgi:hypothetical protein